MKLISSIKEIQAFSKKFYHTYPKHKLGFVPTMGGIHEGHLSLIKEAQKKTQQVIVSIFVNPLQFNKKIDFEQYPRNLKRDQKILQKEGVDVLFTPLSHTKETFLHKKPRLKLSIPSIENTLCAPLRPGHFEGVLFIVYHLLSWVKPNLAMFGFKDYQQYLHIKIMVKELGLPVDIVGSPTIRDSNGLAMSSRNQRLSPQAKEEALILYKTLTFCKKEWQKGASVKDLKKLMQTKLQNQKIEYADIYSQDNLRPIKKDHPDKMLLAVAAWFENVRLIDNLLLEK